MPPELHRSASASSPHTEEDLPRESLHRLSDINDSIRALVSSPWLRISQFMVNSTISVKQFPVVRCCRLTYCLSVSTAYMYSKFPSCTLTSVRASFSITVEELYIKVFKMEEMSHFSTFSPGE